VKPTVVRVVFWQRGSKVRKRPQSLPRLIPLGLELGECGVTFCKLCVEACEMRLLDKALIVGQFCHWLTSLGDAESMAR